MPTVELALAGRHIAAAATRASESLATAARTETPTSTDPLAVVLSTPGTLFSLSSVDRHGERPHRRLRRGKAQRPRRTRPVTVPGQSRLFDRG